MSKNQLRATALAHMYSIVAADWSKTTMFNEFKTLPDNIRKIVENSEVVLETVVENNMEQLYETLKLYFKND
jgi:hypothetical protein